MSIILIDNTINKLNGIIPKDRNFGNSRTLIRNGYNMIQLNLIRLNLDIFNVNNCDVYWTKCKLINADNVANKVEELICKEVLTPTDSRNNPKYLKDFEKFYTTKTLFAQWFNDYNKHNYNDKFIKFAKNSYNHIIAMNLDYLIDKVNQLLNEEISLSKILTPYFYSMVHFKYDDELYQVFDEIVEYYLKELNIDNNQIDIECISSIPVDRTFKKHQLCELNKLLDTVNFNLFGYDNNNFIKNRWISNIIDDDNFFNLEDIISIEKITRIVPIIIDRDSNVKKEYFVEDKLKYYKNNQIYYYNNKWYYKLRYYDIVESRIIKSQYYYYGNEYKYNQYCYNYFLLDKNNTNLNNFYNLSCLYKIIDSKDFLLPKDDAHSDCKSNKTILRTIDKLIKLTEFNYKRSSDKKNPFGIPIKILEEFHYLIDDYSNYLNNNKYISKAKKTPISVDIIEQAKKVFAIIILFQSHSKEEFLSLIQSIN